MSSSSLSRHPHAPSLHDDDDDEDAYTESHHHRDDDDEMTENSSWFTEPHAMRVCRNQRDVIRPEDVVAVFFINNDLDSFFVSQKFVPWPSTTSPIPFHRGSLRRVMLFFQLTLFFFSSPVKIMNK